MTFSQNESEVESTNFPGEIFILLSLEKTLFTILEKFKQHFAYMFVNKCGILSSFKLITNLVTKKQSSCPSSGAKCDPSATEISSKEPFGRRLRVRRIFIATKRANPCFRIIYFFHQISSSFQLS